MRVIGAKLMGSWPAVAQVPSFNLPEIALIGRSNVGKSTLVNALVGRKSLARVSSTPGKTQEAVLFEVELELTDSSARRKVILVDLPGFGYAKVSKGKRQDFHKLIVEYISKRSGLGAICLLNDCRREPGEDEQLIWQAGLQRGCRCGLVVTKTDKLGTNAKAQAVRQVTNFYPEATSVVVSGTNVDKAKVCEGVFNMVIDS